MIDISRYLDFCLDNKLTQEQFTFLYLIYYGTIDRDETKRLIRKYKDWIGINKFISDSHKKDLIDKEFIKIKDESNSFDSFVLTDKFLKLFINDRDQAREVFNLYPGFYKEQIGGQTFILKSYDFESFCRIYNKLIMYSYPEHLEVMKDIQYGIANGLCKYRIEVFTKGMGWLDLRKLRLGNQANNTVKTTAHSSSDL